MLKTKGTNVKLASVIGGKTRFDTKRQTLAAFIEFEGSPRDMPTILPMNEWLKKELRGLEDALRGALPRYMVPPIWVPVSQMPMLAASGKTDRKALTALLAELDADQLTAYGLVESSGRRGSNDHVTPTEQAIIELVAKHLGRDPKTMSPSDSFVRLGGDSIVAIQLIAAARAEGLILATEDILRQPLISDIARNSKAADAETVKEKTVTEPFSLLGGKKEAILDSVAED